VSFRRRRFADAIERQLDLFEQDSAGLLARIEEARAAYADAAEEPEEPEERYSEFLDLVELATDELEEMRDAFAATLDEEAAEEYEQAFDRAYRRRFPILRASG
jgi:septation ring formation regulator EzrA